MAGLTERLTFLIDARTSGAITELRKLQGEISKVESTGKTGFAGLAEKIGLSEKAFGALSISAAAAGAGLVLEFGVKSVEAADHLNKVLLQSKVIFGENVDAIEAFGKASANIGLSTAAAVTAADTFGQLFVELGVGQKQAAEMSKTFTKLGVDLASSAGTDNVTAFTALQKGLEGQTRGLKAFNVVVSASSVAQEALKEGLIKTANEGLTPAQTAIATYNLILQSSTLQQGDFARTAGTVTNQLAIFHAKVADLQEELGQALVPAVVRVVGGLSSAVDVVNNDVIPSFKLMKQGIDEIPKTIDIVINVIPGAGATKALIDRYTESLGLTRKATIDVATSNDKLAVAFRNQQAAGESAKATAVGVGNAFIRSNGVFLNGVNAVDTYTGAVVRLTATLSLAAQAQADLSNPILHGSPGPPTEVNTLVSSFGDALAFTLAQNTTAGVGSGLADSKPAVDELGDYLRAVATDRLSQLGNVIDGLTAKLSFDDATTGLADVQAKLDALKAEAAGSKVAVGQQQSLVGQLLAQATTITPSEQVAIEQAQKNLDDVLARFHGTVTQANAPGSSFLGPSTIDVINGPSATLAEVQVAEENLADAKAKAVGPTQELKDAEKALQDLRDRQLDLPKLIAEAERDVTRARLALVEAERRQIDLGTELIAQGPESVAWYQQIAAQAGLTAGQINGLTASLVALKRESAASQGLVDVFGNGSIFQTPEQANATLTFLGGVPKFAAGGFVSGPAGAPQLAVVHGGERVLTAGQQRNAGGDTFVINVSAWDKASAPAIARAVADEIAARSRRGTPLLVSR